MSLGPGPLAASPPLAAAARPAPRPFVPPPPAPPAVVQSVRYLGTVPITIRGLATRSLYRFLTRGQVVSVDRRDAGALLATQQFISV